MMDSPSSTAKRRAWINSSRQWPTLEEVSASVADDDVFSDGCVTGKIENWLLGCGSEASPQNNSRLSLGSRLKSSSFDDDLNLGADASMFDGRNLPYETGTWQQSISNPGLCMGLNHSMTSTCHSFSSCKTASSLPEVLQMHAENAEETLYELGFGSDDVQASVRIPPRFLTFPSHAHGINFRLFLDSQLRRIHEEDPCLSLASRFRQVEVLTATANAFYGLYAHVSRTALQKLAPPEFIYSSSLEKMEHLRSSARSEPRSPVERLKDTVSKMCLYTGSPRESDSTSPQPSSKKSASFTYVVDNALGICDNSSATKPDLEENTGRISAREAQRAADDGESRRTVEEKQTHQNAIDTEKDHISIPSSGNGNITHNNQISSLVSEDSVIQRHHGIISHQTEQDTVPRKEEIRPLFKDRPDLICPQIVGSAHQDPFQSEEPYIPVQVSEPKGDSTTMTSLPALAPGGSAHCCISVTCLEGGDTPSSFLNTANSSHAWRILPVQTREESFDKEKVCYLNPPTPRGLGRCSNNLEQVNSFELEELHSAGEEDSGQPDTAKATSLLLSRNFQHKGEVTRGDSVQSDSSGYADDDVSPPSNTQEAALCKL